MPGTQDCSLGFGVESVAGTGVTPTRWVEVLGDESLDFNKNVKQGQALRPGARFARSARRVVPTADAGGDFTVEAVSKGMGLFLRWLFGSATSTLVSGTTYQQVFTYGDTPQSLTIQKGIVQAGGTIDAYTFTGCQATGFEFAFPNADICTFKASVDAMNVTTATGYATPSYASEPVSLFQFAGATVSTGALTAPTATALASAATPLAQVRGGSIALDFGLRDDRFNMGGAGRKSAQLRGMPSGTGSIDVEYTSTTFRDAVLNDTPLSLVLTWTTPVALSAGVETLQIVLPEIKLNGKLPTMNGADLVVTSLDLQILDNLTAAQPIWGVLRTSDAAL